MDTISARIMGYTLLLILHAGVGHAVPIITTVFCAGRVSGGYDCDRLYIQTISFTDTSNTNTQVIPFTLRHVKLRDRTSQRHMRLSVNSMCAGVITLDAHPTRDTATHGNDPDWDVAPQHVSFSKGQTAVAAMSSVSPSNNEMDVSVRIYCIDAPSIKTHAHSINVCPFTYGRDHTRYKWRGIHVTSEFVAFLLIIVLCASVCVWRGLLRLVANRSAWVASWILCSDNGVRERRPTLLPTCVPPNTGTHQSNTTEQPLAAVQVTAGLRGRLHRP
jgi:hypothetical protein